MPGASLARRRKARPQAEDLIDEGPAAGTDEEGHVSMKTAEYEDSREDERDESDESSVSGGFGPEEQSEDEQQVNMQDQLKSVSFGTLAKAEASLPLKRKRGSNTTEREDKLATLRARLAELKGASVKSQQSHKSDRKLSGNDKHKSKSVQSDHTRSKDAFAASDSDTDSSSGDDIEGDGYAKSRTSKHAPSSQSSRYQVTRRRAVVDVPKRITRDPRFDASTATNSAARGATQADRTAKSYEFLRAYEDDEMAQLRAAIKRAPSKTDEGRELLSRKLMSMQNRRKAADSKERAKEVVRKHRREERAAVADGKKPFFLKNSETKRRALVDKFEGMKSGERDKAIERRRKKDSAKEKKRMPALRRVAG